MLKRYDIGDHLDGRGMYQHSCADGEHTNADEAEAEIARLRKERDDAVGRLAAVNKWMDYRFSELAAGARKDLKRILSPSFTCPGCLDKGSRLERAREALANLCHDQWSGWMKYVWSKSAHESDGTVIIPKWAVERWDRQMNTSYSDLMAEEKESDRQEADKFIAVIGECPSPGRRLVARVEGYISTRSLRLAADGEIGLYISKEQRPGVGPVIVEVYTEIGEDEKDE